MRYKIEYSITPSDGGKVIDTASSFEFDYLYEAQDFAKAMISATVDYVGYITEARVLKDKQTVSVFSRSK